MYYSCEDIEEVPELSSENKILSFVLSKDNYSKEFSVSENILQGIVDSDIDLEGVTLNITISENASITPDPSTITSVEEPFTLTVTGENGEERIYTISIERALSDANSILEFKLNTENFSTYVNVDSENGIITQRLPENIDLTALDVSIITSDKATISPAIDNLTDFSSITSLIVTSESGVQKTYTIDISSMDENFSQTCNEMNASKWFGGDNRINAPDIESYDRNLGTGQTLILEQDLNPTIFSIYLEDGFRYYEDNSSYNSAVDLKLNIRTINGEILTSTTTNVPSSYDGGSIPFDLSDQGIFLEDNTTYIFQWYLIDGATLGVTAGSSGNTDETSQGFCFNGGYSGQSNISEGSSLEESGVWYSHFWNFNIKLEGKQ